MNDGPLPVLVLIPKQGGRRCGAPITVRSGMVLGRSAADVDLSGLKGGNTVSNRHAQIRCHAGGVATQ